MDHRCRITPLIRILGLSLVALSVGLLAALVNVTPLEAQERSRRVEFNLSVDTSDLDNTADARVRTRRSQEISRIVADRIKTRLDAIEIKNHQVEVQNNNQIQVTVYGRHSADAIKSAVIPPGRLEIRPVLSDSSPWLELGNELPDGIEIRTEPGSFQTDRLFLFSHNAQTLRSFLSRIALEDLDVAVYPHRNGWRTVNLGPALATHNDVSTAQLNHTPSAIPFITLRFDSEAARRIHAGTSAVDARYLAVMLDGELVNLHRFSTRQFSEKIILDCPDFLRSSEARYHWAVQVTGRLAAPIPVQLVETEEL